MKRGKQLTIGLLMCALLAGLLSGCGAGGGKTASATEAEVKACLLYTSSVPPLQAQTPHQGHHCQREGVGAAGGPDFHADGEGTP